MALASVQFFLGQLQAACQASQEVVSIFNQLSDLNWYGISHRNFGWILIQCGDLIETEKELALAEQVYQLNPERFTHGLIALTIHRAELLIARGEDGAAFELLNDAYQTAIDKGFKREATDALFYLNTLQLAHGNLGKAGTNLETVLQDCRRMRMVELEVEVLLVLARLHLTLAATAPDQMSQSDQYARQAEPLAERCGYQLKQANVYNFLARRYLEANQPEQARRYAELARERAWCDGPPYAYQSALNEAEAILAKIKG